MGATTLEEYRRIEKDAALARRFQPILVQEPTTADAIEILREYAAAPRPTTRSATPTEALVAAVEMSDRYLTDRRLPDKAIDLIDQAGARVRLQSRTKGTDVRALEREVDQFVRDKGQAVADEQYEQATQLRDRITELKQRITEAGRRRRGRRGPEPGRRPRGHRRGGVPADRHPGDQPHPGGEGPPARPGGPRQRWWGRTRGCGGVTPWPRAEAWPAPGPWPHRQRVPRRTGRRGGRSSPSPGRRAARRRCRQCDAEVASTTAPTAPRPSSRLVRAPPGFVDVEPAAGGPPPRLELLDGVPGSSGPGSRWQQPATGRSRRRCSPTHRAARSTSPTRWWQSHRSRAFSQVAGVPGVPTARPLLTASANGIGLPSSRNSPASAVRGAVSRPSMVRTVRDLAS
ncbi:hypothetical protein SFUMM280S_04570 [Streptomyces fumanus]